MQWTEWQSHVEAKSSITLRQLVHWLKNTLKLPLRSLQYEGYAPLYNAQAAPSEAQMEQVELPS